MKGYATTYDETIGYEFGEVSSAMQKAIRRVDAKLAGYDHGLSATKGGRNSPGSPIS